MQITCNPEGNWRLYSPINPEGADPLGTVTRDGYDTGALVRLRSDRLVQVNAGVIRTLPPGPIPVERRGPAGANYLLAPKEDAG